MDRAVQAPRLSGGEGSQMMTERLRNRLAKIEGRLALHRYVVYVEDGESEHDALACAGVSQLQHNSHCRT